MGIPRLMIAATGSGSGKTLITCGILQVLVNRGMRPASFKCGPDYIDPMFHSRVIGARSRNLDRFFCSEQTLRYLLKKNSAGCEVAVLEGVMGYYDGLAGISTDASAYDVSKATDTPVVLIVNCKGMSISVLPVIKGFLEYRPDNRIRGVILNQMTAMLYPRMKALIEAELPVKVFGYVPQLSDCVLDSRHLGLVMPDEVRDLQGKLRKLAEVLEESLDMAGLLALAGEAGKPGADGEAGKPGADGEAGKPGADREAGKPGADREAGKPGADREEDTAADIAPDMEAGVSPCPLPVRIGLAQDEAFCFMYGDNLELLRELGAELVEFSPLHDRHLPEGLSGLLLYGGYPELYGKQLSENRSMITELQEAIGRGLPLIAECGGFMYLHEYMEGMDGILYPMVGAVHGKVWRTSRLQRFGYITLAARTGTVFGCQVGEIPAHEFHYFDSDCCGTDFYAQKPLSKRGWECMIGNDHMLAGFPHLHYYGNPKVAAAFIGACGRFAEKEKGCNDNLAEC